MTVESEAEKNKRAQPIGHARRIHNRELLPHLQDGAVFLTSLLRAASSHAGAAIDLAALNGRNGAFAAGGCVFIQKIRGIANRQGMEAIVRQNSADIEVTP